MPYFKVQASEQKHIRLKGTYDETHCFPDTTVRYSFIWMYTQVTFERFYETNKPFKKIEGLTFDNQNQASKLNAFIRPVESDNQWKSVQVIDYYR
ncbi:TPA: hypothetical protein P0E09_003978 [Vibrio harveyi]|uniref:hypothetical protein n=1 Tax=Vibrio harveyi TaxID=669 RepID=UPI002895ACB2|nr:hypothetical protein VHARVF571_320060 [Vibrio harveyi]HDM8055621.1 hypothetical protein [Vibrio harveyi]